MQTVQQSNVTELTVTKAELTLEQFLPIAQLVKSASTDQTRYNLNGVHVNASEGFAEATNGYLMSRIALNSEVKALLGSSDFIIPSEVCLFALKVKAKEQSMTQVKIDFSAKTIEIKNYSTGAAVTLSFIDGKFPNCSAVIPKLEGKSTFQVTLNPELLVTVLESLKTAKKQQMITLTFDINDRMQPVVCDVGGALGVVMPGRKQ